MQNLFLYILIASLTIASPGPGIILTLSNTLHYDLKKSIVEILGISSGMAVIAIIAASGIGILITSSSILLITIKIIGLFIFSIWELNYFVQILEILIVKKD